VWNLKISENYIIKSITNTNYICDEKRNFSVAVDFNEIKIFLWECLKCNDLTKSELLQKVLEEFEISTVLALSEIDVFIKIIKEYGIIA
jgi:hypothetical protein